MKTLTVVALLFLLFSCGAGYHRVRYTEMVVPPNVTLKGNELIVTTHNKGGEGLSVYKIDIDVRDHANH